MGAMCQSGRGANQALDMHSLLVQALHKHVEYRYKPTLTACSGNAASRCWMCLRWSSLRCIVLITSHRIIVITWNLLSFSAPLTVTPLMPLAVIRMNSAASSGTWKDSAL